jgi:endonuclease/exonuclease/phosphatase (EEP) superfamily protein YafD
MSSRLATLAVCGYGLVVVASWLVIELLTDRVWLGTLAAFGPRWVVAIPLLPLTLLVAVTATGRRAAALLGVIGLTGVVVLVGVMDFRAGLGRAADNPLRRMRVMTYNLGAASVTGEAIDRLLKREGVDVAALQECPFYDYSLARLGWNFFYGGNLCLVSRYPFSVPDVTDPDSVWTRNTSEPLRFVVEAPTGRFQLLNVHLGTIRGGLGALSAQGWRGLPQFAVNREEARRESETARERTHRSAEPLVVAGDFNLPVESAIYRAHWGDLKNAFSTCGRGLGHTKFTSLFGIRIDHVLTSEHWVCTDARVLANLLGGDHAPLVVDLRLQ